MPTSPYSARNRQLRAVSSAQFGLLANGSDETAAINAMLIWAGTNKIPLEIEPGTYGFTHISAQVAGANFDISCPRGPVEFVQLSTRTAASMAVQIGGATTLTTTMSATQAAGEVTFLATSVAGVQAGDLALLKTNRLLEGDHRFDGSRSYGQLGKVMAVSGSTVRIADPLVFDFPVGSIEAGTAQAGAAGTITLRAGATVLENDIKGYLLTITGGTGSGQSRYIHTYDPATKIVDIGTSYTGDPQAAFSPVPDATSVYSIAATVEVEFIRPATGQISGLKFIGYETVSVAVNGGQFARWNGGQFSDLSFYGFSNHGLYVSRSYRTELSHSTFARANYGLVDGGGLGYGHIDQFGFANSVMGCHAHNCRTGFDNGVTTLFLRREGNTATGGGISYNLVDSFFPDGTFPNSGFSSHTGSYGCTDDGNRSINVLDNKIRAQEYRVQNHQHLGQSGAEGVFKVSYSPSAEIVGCSYDDLVTGSPDRLTNSTGLSSGLSVVGMPAVYSRAANLVMVRHNTMPKNSRLVVKGNTAKNLTEALVLLDETVTTSNLDLTVHDNHFGIISIGAIVLSAVKATGALALRNGSFINNHFDAGGVPLGALQYDNYAQYAILADLTAGSAPVRIGGGRYAVVLADDTATRIPAQSSQFGTSLANIYELTGAITNRFLGILTNGSATPISTLFSSGVNLYTSTLAGTTGTDVALNIAPRADGAWYIENRTGATRTFILEIGQPWA